MQAFTEAGHGYMICPRTEIEPLSGMYIFKSLVDAMEFAETERSESCDNCGWVYDDPKCKCTGWTKQANHWNSTKAHWYHPRVQSIIYRVWIN